MAGASSSAGPGGQGKEGMRLVDLIIALVACTDPVCLGLAGQLACWAGSLLDCHPWVQSGSTYAFLAPMPRGTKRARTVDPRAKEAKTTDVASGVVGRTG